MTLITELFKSSFQAGTEIEFIQDSIDKISKILV